MKYKQCGGNRFSTGLDRTSFQNTESSSEEKKERKQEDRSMLDLPLVGPLAIALGGLLIRVQCYPETLP
jgi:hypothetical protein